MKTKITFIVLLLVSTLCSAQRKQPVKWTFEASPVRNGEAVLTFTATMEGEWHIYSQFMEEDGPMPTKFEFTPSAEYELTGAVKEESKRVEKFDSTFFIKVIWFDKTAVFTQRIKLKAPAATIKGMVTFMACRAEECLLPEEKPFAIKVGQ